MSLPSTNPTGQQSSIRSFFQPRAPTFAPPPSSSSASAATPPPPPPPPPPASAAASAAPPSASPAAPSPRPQLHPQATICPATADHVPALRRITSLLLPINYPDAFWARLADPESSGAFSRVLLWSDPADGPASPQTQKVVGGLVCRPEPSPFRQGSHALYIQSLVLLSPYRRLGLAAALLDDVARAASGPKSPWPVDVVYAHVWTDNADGLAWYLARGFQRGAAPIPGYYYKLRPDSAWIVSRPINGGGALSAPPPATTTTTTTTTAEPPKSVTAAAANLTPHPPPPPPSSNGTGPPPGGPPRRPGAGAAGGGGRSFQNCRAETEWNDLPADMHSSSSNNLLSPPAAGGANGSGDGSGPPSGASSRSSSAARKKRDRAYPAAAFGK